MLILVVSVALAATLIVAAAVVWRVRSARRARRSDALDLPSATVPPPPAEVAREGLGSRVRSLFRGGPVGPETWERLEDLLVRADTGPLAAGAIVERVRAQYGEGADPESLLVEEIAAVFEGDGSLQLPDGELGVIMVVGVNGSGKTTTIGKLAAMLGRGGAGIGLAGCDTFRAAAGEQLEIWARRAGADLVSQARGADPGSVAFDAVQAARARGSSVLIVDTAGRLHTRTPLMDELAKVKRVLEKASGRVHEVLLVLDGTTGQNGIAQARAFTDAVGVTGIALTKLDGTAKGGIVLAVREELGVPVKLVGTGENLGDIELFDPRAFADRLVRS